MSREAQQCYRKTSKTTYSLIYGQCSNALRMKLDSRSTHKAMEATADLISLLENIRATMFQFQLQRYDAHALYEVTHHHFYTFTQDKQMPCQNYHEAFMNNVEVIEYCGGAIGNQPGLINSKLASSGLTQAYATPAQLVTAKCTAREHILGCVFLLGSDKTRY
jgi:hypothetical protein